MQPYTDTIGDELFMLSSHLGRRGRWLVAMLLAAPTAAALTGCTAANDSDVKSSASSTTTTPRVASEKDLQHAPKDWEALPIVTTGKIVVEPLIQGLGHAKYGHTPSDAERRTVLAALPERYKRIRQLPHLAMWEPRVDPDLTVYTNAWSGAVVLATERLSRRENQALYIAITDGETSESTLATPGQEVRQAAGTHPKWGQGFTGRTRPGDLRAKYWAVVGLNGH